MSEPTDDRTTPTMGDHSATIKALGALAEEFGELPKPYIVMHRGEFLGTKLQLDTPQDFELWRVALQIPPSAVELQYYNGLVWLAAMGQFCGASVNLTGYEVPLTVEQATSSPVAEPVSA